MGINVENLGVLREAADGGVLRKRVLPGEIDGLDLHDVLLLAEQSYVSAAEPGVGRVLLFTAGSGLLEHCGESVRIDEITLFAPRYGEPVSLSGQGPPLELLEMDIRLQPEEVTELQDAHDTFPLHQPYSTCKTYRERIKSEKTVSRTLLPEHTFPRFCVGSVETTGPDHVAAHEHAMLEQLFFGLAGNHCVVKADAEEVLFGENDLLHIPLGSTHSVDVHEPHSLHYVWIDLFRDKRGMDWITQEHVTEE